MQQHDEALKRDLLDLLPRLRRFAYSLTGQRSDGDDLLQTTVERLLSRGVPQDGDLQRWSFRVCKNIFIDEIRARKVRLEAVADGRIEVSYQVDGERMVMNRLTMARVAGAMQALPDDQRIVLSLVAIDGQSYAEAAETTGVPIGTVMSRVARARKALASLLDADTTDSASGRPGAQDA